MIAWKSHKCRREGTSARISIKCELSPTLSCIFIQFQRVLNKTYFCKKIYPREKYKKKIYVFDIAAKFFVCLFSNLEAGNVAGKSKSHCTIQSSGSIKPKHPLGLKAYDLVSTNFLFCALAAENWVN